VVGDDRQKFSPCVGCAGGMLPPGGAFENLNWFIHTFLEGAVASCNVTGLYGVVHKCAESTSTIRPV